MNVFSGLKVRRVQERDLSTLVRLLNKAYSMWENLELDTLVYSRQSIQADFLKYGYVIVESKKVIGCFCLRAQKVRVQGNYLCVVRATEKDMGYVSKANADRFQNKKIAYLYKLAVHPNRTRSGIGSEALRTVGHLTRKFNCDGILLETALETRWLVSWYRRLGFRIVARDRKKDGARKTTKIFMYALLAAAVSGKKRISKPLN